MHIAHRPQILQLAAEVQEMTQMQIASAYAQNGSWEIRDLRALDMPRTERSRTVRDKDLFGHTQKRR